MNQAIINNERKLRCKTPIVILLTVCLISDVISCMSYCAYTAYSGVGLSIEFWIFRLVDIAPPILFLIYIFKFFKHLKATIIVPLIFALLAAGQLLDGIDFLRLVFLYEFSPSLGIYILNGISCAIAYSFGTICALKGFSNKLLVVIPIGTVLAINFFSLLNSIPFGNYYISVSSLLLLNNFSATFSSIALNAALLLFGLKNRNPTILSTSPEREQKKMEKMSPEQALRLLKEKLELGMITEEEYQSQRAEIISKL